MLKYPWLITNHCKILYSKRLPVCMSWDQASYFYKLDMTSWDQPWQLSSGLSSCYLPVINRSRWFTPGRHALSVSSSFLMSSPPHLVFNKKNVCERLKHRTVVKKFHLLLQLCCLLSCLLLRLDLLLSPGHGENLKLNNLKETTIL